MGWLQSMPKRGHLPPQKALDLATLYLEQAHKTKDPVLALEICLDAENALYRIQRSDQKSLVEAETRGTDNADKALCKAIATTLSNLGELFGSLGYLDHSKRGYKYATRWGHVKQGSAALENTLAHHRTISIDKGDNKDDKDYDSKDGDNDSSSKGRNSNNDSNGNSDNNHSNKNAQASANTATNKADNVIQAPKAPITHNIINIPQEIFSHDIPRVVSKYSLPSPGTHLSDTQQLAYSLSLLPTAPILKKDRSDQEQEWYLARSNDRDEQERLHSLASDVITMFICDPIKAEATVAEVVLLAPVLDFDQYRTLLMAFINGVDQDILLKTHLLEGLAPLMQYAPPGYLDSDDLINILDILSSRLQDTHAQSGSHIYQLCVAVSHVLDAMVRSQVKGLKREQLQEPLAAYLKELKDSSDPHLVYYAAYASQALLYIPNDETTMQAMLRRTSVVAQGVFGVVSAVKDWDLDAFMDELVNIQKELPPIVDVIEIGRNVCDGVVSLYESGMTFKQSMEEGLAFICKSAWYPALCEADAFLHSGELTKFKALVCEAPCRRDLAFQWGICLRLGQIAANPQWAMHVRQDAINLLGDIYKNDKDWSDHAQIKQWIITILKRLISLPKEDLQAAGSLLNDLATTGDVKKQQLYKDCFNGPAVQFPFIVAPTSLASSSLLDRVQNKPDVEKSLSLLKRQRAEIRGERGFYVQQYAKANPQANDENLFLLMDKVKEFLGSERKVMLVQGSSGAGKSTFNRTLESTLWNEYQKKHGRIPLFINLPSIENPTKNMIAKQFQMYGFTEAQIKELKMNRSLILICDGYDETMQTSNLYVTNHLNQPGEWMCQMVISCRSEYLGIDYQDRFQPMDRNHQADAVLFQEAMIVPFSARQIDDYIEQYVAAMDLLWAVQDYQRALKMVPSLRELVKNPFLLSLSLDVLPRMVDPQQDNTKTPVKRITLYDKFIEQWLERGKKRLGEILMSEDKKMFQTLCDEGFAQNGIRYLTELAMAIYKHQDGNPVVDYSPSKDKGTWKEEYFSRESGRKILREASPLNRTGSQYRFYHRSILEYCVVRAMFEPRKETNAIANDSEAIATSTSRRKSISSVFSFEMEANNEVKKDDPTKLDETLPLVWRSFINEPSILEFLEDRVRLEAEFKQQLYEYVELSKSAKKWRIAAANAMTILVRAGESFAETDLRGIQIPGADLSHGIFDCAQLQGADLRRANLRSCSLREADLSGAYMLGVQFGEWPLLREGKRILKGSYSPDGKTLAAAVHEWETNDNHISVYDTLTWEKRMELEVNEGEHHFVYSPDSQHIAVWCRKSAISVFDTTSGAKVHSLEDQKDIINDVVYSPSGAYLASACKDGFTYVWDTMSGRLQHKLWGHIGEVTKVTYSPDGKQIATGGHDNTVRLWDMASGEPIQKLQVPSSRIEQIVYLPDSQEIIVRGGEPYSLDVWDITSGQNSFAWDDERSISHITNVQHSPEGKFTTTSDSNGVIQWNMQTREHIHAFKGPALDDLAYSPNGEQIATCTSENAVRLWDFRTGELTNTFYAHSNVIKCMVYSPDSHQIASFSEDGTVGLWDAQARQSSHGYYAHIKSISRLRLSPNGQHIVSCSLDNTIRAWDSQTGQYIYGVARPIKEIEYSSDGRLIASCGRCSSTGIYIWDTQSGQAVRVLELQGQSDDAILVIAASPIGHQVACGHNYGNVSLWNTQTGQLTRTLQGNGRPVDRVLFSPKGHQIASSDYARRIRVWEADTGDLLYELAAEYKFSSLVYSPDSQMLAFIQDTEKLQLRNAGTGELCYEIMLDELGRVIAFSPCGRRMVIGSLGGPISMLDTESGTMLYTLEGHNGLITSMSYSCDGQYIASCSTDQTARLWDPESGQCLATIPFVGGDAETLVWNVSESGCFLVTGHDDGAIRMWQVSKKENGQCRIHLRWSTTQLVLNATRANIRDVIGLSGANRKLLEQHGAVDESTQYSAFQEASQETKEVASIASEFKGLESEEPDTNSNRDTSRKRSLIAKSEATKGHQFICSKCGECDKCETAHFIINGSYESACTGLHYKSDN